jgi:hypothetical protein
MCNGIMVFGKETEEKVEQSSDIQLNSFSPLFFHV